MVENNQKTDAPVPGDAKVKKTLVIELDEEANDIKVKSNFHSVFEAVAMLERAKHFIQKQEDDVMAQSKINSLLLEKMASLPNAPGARRPN